jgi:hypothetical protein
LIGAVDGRVTLESSDKGTNNEVARSSMDIVNYDVRAAIVAAEARSSRSNQPAEAFARELREQVLGHDGLRNRYLQQGDSARGTLISAARSHRWKNRRFSEPVASPGSRSRAWGRGQPAQEPGRLAGSLVPEANVPEVNDAGAWIGRIEIGTARPHKRPVWPCIRIVIFVLNPILAFNPSPDIARGQ